MTNLESLIRAAFAKGFEFADDRQSADEDIERAWQMHKDELLRTSASSAGGCPHCGEDHE